MRDGTGGHVVQRPRQPALPHRHGDVRQRGDNRRRRHPRLLAAGLHGLPHFLEEGSRPVVNNVGHRNKEKETKLKSKRKMSNQKKNVKKRNRNQGKIQRYMYRK
jgi:hypothetical protein